MKKLVLQIVFGFLVLPLGVAGALYQLNKNGFFNVTKIDVILEDAIPGQEQFLKPHVEKLESLLAPHKGVSLWNVKLKKISSQVSSLNWVDDLNIKREWPSTISVRVRPYEVKLLYMAKTGKLIPIIKDGTFLDPVDSKEAPDVVLAEGDVFLKKTALRKKAVDVLDQIPKEGSFSKKTISEIRYDSKEGFWMTLIKTGVQVKMGEDQMSLKAARVSQVVDYLDSRQFDARVIDANLSKKVLVRLRKDP